jgi:uncharacterized protein
MVDFDKLNALVKKGLKKDHSGHDYAHTMRVYSNAIKIAHNEKTDIVVVKLAVLFHDYAYSSKFFSGEHGDVSAKLSKPILEKLNITDEQKQLILFSIVRHNYWYHKQRDVPIETKILRDADRLDAIGYTGIFRAISYAINAKIDVVGSLKFQLRLEKEFETKKGKELAKPRLAVLKTFIKNLEKEF